MIPYHFYIVNVQIPPFNQADCLTNVGEEKREKPQSFALFSSSKRDPGRCVVNKSLEKVWVKYLNQYEMSTCIIL